MSMKALLIAAIAIGAAMYSDLNAQRGGGGSRGGGATARHRLPGGWVSETRFGGLRTGARRNAAMFSPKTCAAAEKAGW